MGLFSKPRFVALSRFLSRLPGFSRPEKHSIVFLNIAQFCGVLNDNIFKLVIVFLLITVEGQKSASTILSTAGAIFVIPFLLFSSAAGVIADRFSKQRLLIAMKGIEICIMALAIFAFGLKSAWASYTLLFLLSTHSAMFGPSKYAIISELVPSDRISRANGLITSFTYLGMVIGTFLASFVTDISGRNFILVAGFCLFIAVTGFISTFGIRYTPPQGSDKKINPFFLQEIWETLKLSASRKHLLVAIFGAAYFLFIGAYTQLNIIPFAIESLNLSEIAGGYLFLSTAFGIAFGAYIAGKASRTRVELGLSCFACLIVALLLLFLSFFPNNLIVVVFILVLLGVFGGLFTVPLDSFIQIFSPDEKRGQIIATSNFLSFLGVLVASFTLYFYSQVLEISSAAGFGITGLITLFLSFLMISRLSDLAIHLATRKLLKPLLRLKVANFELVDKNPSAIIALRKASWLKTLALCSIIPKIHILIPRTSHRRFPWFNWTFYSIHLIPTDPTFETLLKTAKELASDTINPCIFIEDAPLPEAIQPASKFASFFKLGADQLIYADIDFSSAGTSITFSKR